MLVDCTLVLMKISKTQSIRQLDHKNKNNEILQSNISSCQKNRK